MKPSTIVWAEDDQDDLELIAEVLSTMDDAPSIEFVTNGSDAYKSILAMISNGVIPGLIILDENMPVMNGLETYTLLSAHIQASAIPTVFFSTTVTVLAKCQELANSGVALFTKPSTFGEWRGVIQEMMSHISSGA